jgi:hypothetical protein
MAEMSVFAEASFKVQFRTSLPTEENDRSARQNEYAALLKQIQGAVHDGVTHTRAPGWEVVLVEDET